MKEYLLTILMVFVFSSSPLIVETSLAVPLAETNVAMEVSEPPMPNVEPSDSEGTNAIALSAETEETMIDLLDHRTDTVSKISLEEYLVGVVFAEMPASFHEEALKAQAVAARSYLLRRTESGYGREKHDGNADVCTDSTHCTAFYSYEDAVAVWNEATVSDAFSIVRKAVEGTKGEVLTYEGEIADCLFHAASYRKTESAENVWGNSVPYLVPVITSEEAIKKEIRVSTADFKRILLTHNKKMKLSSSPSDWLEGLTRTEGGRVEDAIIGGVVFKGTLLRTLFSLPSSDFTVSFSDGCFVFHCLGYGHGVGLSQYGADFLGKEGCSYRDILAHYYPLTVLETR